MTSLNRRKFSAALTVLTPVLIVLLACAQTGLENRPQPMAGGPCAYKSYPGRATILSIGEIRPVGPTDVQRFEVNFSFVSRRPVSEEFARPAGRIFMLYGDHFRHPDRSFLIRHDIRVGKEIEGAMQVIMSGTCTPVLFDFPSLRQDFRQGTKARP